jgi:hypothetical protein
MIEQGWDVFKDFKEFKKNIAAFDSHYEHTQRDS